MAKIAATRTSAIILPLQQPGNLGNVGLALALAVHQVVREVIMDKVDPSTMNLMIITTTVVIAIGLIAAAVAFVIVGRAAFHASSPSAAASFGLFFHAAPALTTIVFIVLATATLTAMGLLRRTDLLRSLAASPPSFSALKLSGGEGSRSIQLRRENRERRRDQPGVAP